MEIKLLTTLQINDETSRISTCVNALLRDERVQSGNKKVNIPFY